MTLHKSNKGDTTKSLTFYHDISRRKRNSMDDCSCSSSDEFIRVQDESAPSRNLHFSDYCPAEEESDNLYTVPRWMVDAFLLIQVAILLLVTLSIFCMLVPSSGGQNGNSSVSNTNQAGQSGNSVRAAARNQMKQIAAIKDDLCAINRDINSLRRSMQELEAWRRDTESRTKNSSELSNSVDPNVQTMIEDKISETLDLYDADKIGLIDYALESAGATILATPDTKPYPGTTTFQLFTFLRVKGNSEPQNMLQPNTAPGQCFAFHTNQGKIILQLAKSIRITNFTVDHVHPKLVDDISSAPKDFVIYGLNSDNDEREELARFAYNTSLQPIQTFPADNATNSTYEFIELNILSNYGNKDFTCIYRFRVHGIPGNRTTEIDIEDDSDEDL